MIRERLEAKLRDALAPDVLVITDESHRHVGHAGWREGGETHFSLQIVSAAFEGLSRVARQRLVYGIVGEEFEAGLHALSLDLKSPKEARTDS